MNLQDLNAENSMSLLYANGWSSGDTGYVLDGARTWLVYCHRNGDEILATAKSHREA